MVVTAKKSPYLIETNNTINFCPLNINLINLDISLKIFPYIPYISFKSCDDMEGFLSQSRIWCDNIEPRTK